MTRPRTRSTRESALIEVAHTLYRLARRYAVGQSSSPADALLYDACLSTIAAAAAEPDVWQARLSPSATHDRYVRRGSEEIRETFALPATVDDAVALLHRFARRYANGRGTLTAPLVNQAARDLERLGVDLSPTAALDGTIWAADGFGGVYDGLDPAARDQALQSARSVPASRNGA